MKRTLQEVWTSEESDQRSRTTIRIQVHKRLIWIVGNTRKTTYHPQTDRMNERSHQETEQFLAAFVNFHQNDWVKWLDIAEFTQNDHVHAETKQTPFFLLYGKHPWKGIETGHQSISPEALSLHEKMKKVHDEAKAANKIAQEIMKGFYDRTKGKSIEYKEGDKVWLEGKNLRPLNRPTKKMANKRHGPFPIIEKIGRSAHRLKLPKTWSRIHPVFNEVLLSPYHEGQYKRQAKPSPPIEVEVEGHPEYEVESILDVKQSG